MASTARIDELKKRFDENPRRYFAPLANEYRKAGDLEEAVALCRAHLVHQPGHISGHIVLAQALYEARELDESRQVFEAALDLDPENLIALRHLGDIAFARGDLGGARGWYQRVLESDPRNDEIHRLIAELGAETVDAPVPAEAFAAYAPPEIESAPPAVSAGVPVVALGSDAVADLALGLGIELPLARTEGSAPSLAPEPVGSDADAPVGFDLSSLDGFRDTSSDFDAAVHFGDLEAAADPLLDWGGALGELPTDDPEPGALEVPVESGSTFSADALLAAFEDAPLEEATSAAPAVVDPVESVAGGAAEDAAVLAAPEVPSLEIASLDAFGVTEAPEPTHVESPLVSDPAWEWGDGAEGTELIDAGTRLSAEPLLPVEEPVDEPLFGAEEVTALVTEEPEFALQASGEAEELVREESDVHSPDIAEPQLPPTPANPFVTETMAELYLRQGFQQEALAVYRRLLEASPDDQALRARVERLERGELPSPASSAADTAADGGRPVPKPSARAFFARLASRKALGRQARLESASAAAGTEHQSLGASVPDDASAVSAPQMAGRPARAADDELSLDSIFGARGAPPPSTAAPFSFDQFFSGATRHTVEESPAASSGEGSPRGAGDDIEQFTAWLEGLRKK